MKLGTLKSNVKDGELVVVSRDNEKAVRVPSLAQNLQQALENWTDCAPRLKEVYDQINRNEIETFDVL